MAILSSLYVVSSYTDGTSHGDWMRVDAARRYAKGFTQSPIAKQIVVVTPNETHVWHNDGKGWVTVSATEWRQRMAATLN